MTALSIFIGYDSREDEAYRVCRASLLRRSSRDLHILGIDETVLRASGWFTRQSYGEGVQKFDALDRKPFSTAFSFTRFLVPALSMYQGWALYCDCDFLFQADVSLLFEKADPAYAVMCVKHHHDPGEKIKMAGQTQTRYHRKNWSSLILWNCAHPANAALTPWHVNNFPGSWLHAFQWLEDEQIGDIPRHWNWLSGVSAPLPGEMVPSAIHYTLGTPNLQGHEDCPYADLWRAERASSRPAGMPTPSERMRAVESLDAA